MEKINELIIRAQDGDLEAYDEIVRRFQDMAVAYAFSIMGDFHWAEDAAQEAFIEAFCELPKLQEPLAFAGWLRRIVFKHCDRITRKKQVQIVPLDAALDESDLKCEPLDIIEEREVALQVREAVTTLPENERSVTVLFYMGEHSQQQIAEWLEVPVTTVKKRLHTARKKLKEKMIHMIQENLEEQRPSRNPQFTQQIQSFTRQFSQMVHEGQSLVRSLTTLAESQDADLQMVITQINQDVQAGETLSGAMQKHPNVFNQTYVDNIRQGEINGNLDDVLQRLSIQ